jgi:hypothetical protein
VARCASMRGVWRIVVQPVRDYMDALHACLGNAPVRYALVVIVAFALAWWVYVPLHELLHAYGCLLTGGAVTRLEIDWIYGAPLLARVFPFVSVGSEYAGQLTGFDTHGNDIIYLATDFLPFVLTVVIGVPLLRAVPRWHGSLFWRCAMLGAALPIAYAPFVSLTGDYYEMGSILVTRAVALWSPGFQLARWRSDDVFRLAAALAESDGSVADAVGVTSALLVGVVLAFTTYWLGTLAANFLFRRPTGPGMR